MDDKASDENFEVVPATSKEPTAPAFEVGPPGVGPVTGIHSGDFFHSPRADQARPVEQADE